MLASTTSSSRASTVAGVPAPSASSDGSGGIVLIGRVHGVADDRALVEVPRVVPAVRTLAADDVPDRLADRSTRRRQGRRPSSRPRAAAGRRGAPNGRDASAAERGDRRSRSVRPSARDLPLRCADDRLSDPFVDAVEPVADVDVRGIVRAPAPRALERPVGDAAGGRPIAPASGPRAAIDGGMDRGGRHGREIDQRVAHRPIVALVG